MAKIHPYDGSKTFCNLPVSGVKDLTLVPAHGTCGACKQALRELYRTKIESSADKDIARAEYLNWYNNGKSLTKKIEKRKIAS